MKKYRLLLTDLDGTLLNSRSEITETSLAALAAAKAADRHVALCSGRSWMSLDHYEKKFGLDTPGCYGVSFNGAAVYERRPEGRRFLALRPMENALGREVARVLKEAGADVLLYAGDELLAEKETLDLKYYTGLSRIRARIVADVTETEGDVMKVIVRGRNADLVSLERQMAPRFAGRCLVFFSAGDLLEFSHPEAHKGAAAAFLAGHLGVPLSEVIAVGDQSNDVSMLRTAGLGIAVANASPDAREAADIVLPESCDEDAVARVIREYLL